MKHLYEINTAVWLARLSDSYDQAVTLANIPEQELDRIASYGMDAVWLMGIWERSPVAAAMSREDESLRNEAATVLPDFSDDDIIGSAYAVKSYTIDPRFGDNSDLQNLRNHLRERGLKLFLDFVPNHTSFDNAWLAEHSDYYILGDQTQFENEPARFYDYNGIVVARGRDPNLDPWPDVAQLNAFSSGYRQASVDTLRSIAEMCDGVRCDMAMLLLNESYKRTWTGFVAETPAEEYWQLVISAVKQASPNFIFIAETYWDKERQLIDFGFDYCYDKTLYDYLAVNDTSSAERHSEAVADIASRLVHFLENHDEARAASVFAPETHAAAAQLIIGQPGLCLWHDGQFEGYLHKVPVHLARGPQEATNPAIHDMYQNLLSNIH